MLAKEASGYDSDPERPSLLWQCGGRHCPAEAAAGWAAAAGVGQVQVGAPHLGTSVTQISTKKTNAFH